MGARRAAPRRRAAVQHRPAGHRLHAAHRRHRHRRGMGGRADPPARPAGLEHPARGAAGRPGLRQQLRLGVADLPGRGLRRGAAGGDAVLLPAGVPARRRGAARAGPRPGGDRAQPRPRSLAHVRPGDAAAAAARDVRRRAAGRTAPAGRVRRPAAAALRHLHHGHLRPVPLLLQRPRGDHAGQRAGAVLPAAADCSRCGCAGTTATPGSAAASPAPCRGDGSAARSCRCWPA